MSSEAMAFAVRHSPYRGVTFTCHLMVGDIVNDAYANEFWMSVGALSVKARTSRGVAGTALSTLVGDGYLTLLEERPGGTNLYRFEFPEVPVVFESRTRVRFSGDGRKVRVQRAPSPGPEVRAERAGRCALNAQGVRAERAGGARSARTNSREISTNSNGNSNTDPSSFSAAVPPPWIADDLTFAEWVEQGRPGEHQPEGATP